MEEIVDSKLLRGKLHYLVKWKGYPREEWTWEPRAELMKHARKAVEAFHKAHPSAPQPAPRQLCFQKLENYTVPGNVPAYLFNWESGIYERTEQLISRTRSLRGG